MVSHAWIGPAGMGKVEARCLIPGLGARPIGVEQLAERAGQRSVTTKAARRLNRLELSEIKVADHLQGFGRRAVLQVAG